VLYLGTMVAQLKRTDTTYNDVIAYITGLKNDQASEEVRA